VDHGLTCTATVRWSTIRLIVAYAAAMVNVKLYQSDLPNAYMQAPTPGVRYMHFPVNFHKEHLNTMTMVKNCVYK
jgi:hypothetical protein